MSKLKNTLFLYFLLFLTSIISLRSINNVQINHILIKDQLISKEELLENSSLKIPQRLIFIQTGLIEKELKENLSLKYISINKQLIPFGLKIFIQKRIPIAYAEMYSNDSIVEGFVDEEGVFISKKFINSYQEDDFTLKVYGWKKSFIEPLEKILRINNKFDIKIYEINISPNGFISLREEDFKKVSLGFTSENIERKLDLLISMKNQLKEKKIFKDIQSLDLTDPSNPLIKVFKP